MPRPFPGALPAFLALTLLACPSPRRDASRADSALRAEDTTADMDEGLPEDVPAAAVPATGDVRREFDMDVSVTITGDSTYAGSYHASGMARACEHNPSGLAGRDRQWALGFGQQGTIPDLTFDATPLDFGGTSEDFSLSLTVVRGGRQQAPSLIIRPGRSRNDHGRVTLVKQSDRSTRTVIQARNDRATVDMTVVCETR